MRFSILSIALSLLVFQVAAGNLDDATDSTTGSHWDWETFEILNQLIGETETAIDDDTAFELDSALSNCDDEARSHGQFVNCGKIALNKVKNDLLDGDYKLIKKAMVQSDFGKSAVELIIDETAVVLDDSQVKTLDECEQNAESLEGYKSCMNDTLKTIALRIEDAALIKQAIQQIGEIQQEDGDEYESQT